MSSRNARVAVVLLTITLCSCSGGGGGSGTEEASAGETSAPVTAVTGSEVPVFDATPGEEPAVQMEEAEPPAQEPVSEAVSVNPEVSAEEPVPAVEPDEASGATEVAAGSEVPLPNAAPEVVSGLQKSVALLDQISPKLLVRGIKATGVVQAVNLAPSVNLSCSEEGSAALSGAAHIVAGQQSRSFTFEMSAELADCDGLNGTISAGASGSVAGAVITQSVSLNGSINSSSCLIILEDVALETSINIIAGAVQDTYFAVPQGTVTGQASAVCLTTEVHCTWVDVDYSDIAALESGCSSGALAAGNV
ncbi:MAG TPA: hypothetical protein PLP17_00870 [Oligoflexia bacterium]|nr:hypothetical protein [Oligoflexia bacterium]